MAHREAFFKNTKNYQMLANKFEERLVEVVEDLVEERNGLKRELAVKNAKLIEYERSNVQWRNQIEVLKEQLRSAKENFNTTDFYAKNVLVIAQTLAHDNVDKDIDRDPLHSTLLPPPSVPASNSVTPQAQPILNVSNAASNNMEVAADDGEVVILDNNDDEDNAVQVHEIETAEISDQQNEPQMGVVLNL